MFTEPFEDRKISKRVLNVSVSVEFVEILQEYRFMTVLVMNCFFLTANNNLSAISGIESFYCL